MYYYLLSQARTNMRLLCCAPTDHDHELELTLSSSFHLDAFPSVPLSEMESQSHAPTTDGISFIDGLLPGDLWFEIAELLEPSEVLALGQVGNSHLRGLNNAQELRT